MCVDILDVLEPPAGYKYISVVMTDGHVRNLPKNCPLENSWFKDRSKLAGNQGMFESFKFIRGF